MMIVLNIVVAIALVVLVYVFLAMNDRLRRFGAELSAMRTELRRLRNLVEQEDGDENATKDQR